MTRTIAATGMVGIALLAATVVAQEQKLAPKDLPPAVEKTVAEQSKGATIKGLSSEVENGQKIYEAALVLDGHNRDISIDENGRVLEVEDEVALASLPAAVQDGLKRAAGQGKLGKVESLTKDGRLVAYESVVTMGGKRHEVQVGPDGRKPAHPE